MMNLRPSDLIVDLEKSINEFLANKNNDNTIMADRLELIKNNSRQLIENKQYMSLINSYLLPVIKIIDMKYIEKYYAYRTDAEKKQLRVLVEDIKLFRDVVEKEYLYYLSKLKEESEANRESGYKFRPDDEIRKNIPNSDSCVKNYKNLYDYK